MDVRGSTRGRRAAILCRGLRTAILAALVGACSSGPDVAEVEEIRELTARREGLDRLLEQTRSDEAPIRVMACNALAAFADDDAVAALVERLADPEVRVRYAATFALGQIGNPIAASALKPRLRDEDANLRLLAARALGATGDDGDADALLGVCADDDEPAVRGAAGIAVGRVMERAPAGRASRVERRLAALLAAETDETVRWRIAWALTRFGSDGAADVVGPLAGAAGAPNGESTPRPERWTRVMALRALGRRGAPGPVLVAALADVEPQVALAALHAIDDAVEDGAPLPDDVLAALSTFMLVPLSPHVLARAIELLDAHPPTDLERALTTPGVATLDVALVDHPSPTVRAAALRALARHTAGAVPLVAARLGADDPLDRIAAAEAARSLPDADAEPLLRAALDDADVRVRTAAVRSLAGHRDAPWLDELLERAAAERDLALREELGVAIAALAPGRGAIARRAFEDSPGDAFAEARKALCEAAVAADPDAADLDDWLRACLADPALAVRRAAARQLDARGAEHAELDEHDAEPFPRVGAEVPFEFLATQAKVELETTKGTIELILVPAAAPVHVWNFLQLVAAGRYDGTVFHRVVPDFVVQGGSVRGDGYDNRSWLDGRLRDEFSPMPFLAGVVGMPKTADPDTGGGQFFVTLVPTPHLDGHYTALGRVNIGLAVAESIEVGDRIVRAVVKSD